jgi:nicotinamide-nucleotide amidase
MGDVLVEDAEALEQITAWFAARGRPMNELNKVQAQRPSRGTMISNEFGTAPGIVARIAGAGGGDGADVFCLPGPPRELTPMFERSVRPLLRPDPSRTVAVRVLHTIGMGESDIAQRFRGAPGGDLMARGRVPLVGTTASNGVVSCRIRYEGPLAADGARELLDRDERAIRSMIGEAVFGVGDDTLASVILRTLREHAQTLTTVESCTGGMVCAMITDVPGASDVYKRGWVTYSNEAKIAEVGVGAELFRSEANPGAPGAVSPEVALAMARGGLREAGADYAVSVTGIAGPGGGSKEKPVGTVFIALACREGAPDVRRFAFVGDRGAIREWSARAALAMVWLSLSGRRSVRLLREA